MYLCTSQSEMSTIMPRESRTPSGTGIYHVMMRGINHQDLFEDEEDYYQFLSSMDYGFSSWHEYSRKETPLFSLCDTQTVLRRIPFLSLEEMVNSLVPDDLHCLDIEDCAKMRPSGDQVWNIILTITGVSNMGDFQRLGKPQRDMALIELRRQGASVRQLERLTGVGRGLCHRMVSCFIA